MESDNFLFLPSDTRERFIYRIISIERLIETFASRNNTLVKPRLWDDPFENFILRCRIRLPDGAFATFGFQDQFFGQCWTLQSGLRCNVADLLSKIECGPNSDNDKETRGEPLSLLRSLGT